ncbi:hypothetical protein NUW54_g9038 [Trametes sanguinea]|uniref:Uncharacterized protein n=1 Tax=Trametes sanguinea TaxID=158606 RepID=A0ACC1PBN6_9APHY|nr:hypothetical protein NUW54_g9038 [Trametes sanguinea]
MGACPHVPVPPSPSFPQNGRCQKRKFLLHNTSALAFNLSGARLLLRRLLLSYSTVCRCPVFVSYSPCTSLRTAPASLDGRIRITSLGNGSFTPSRSPCLRLALPPSSAFLSPTSTSSPILPSSRLPVACDTTLLIPSTVYILLLHPIHPITHMECTTFTTLPLDVPMEGIISLSNSFAFINLLPVELLIKILGELRRAAGFNGDLVAATTSIKLDHVPAAMAFLVRSQSLPISVFVGAPLLDILPDVAHALQPHLHRVQAVDGEFYELRDLLALPRIFLRPAAVETCSLYLGDEAAMEFFNSETHSPHDVLPVMRAELLPNLKELTATSVPGLTLNGFTQLSILTLDGFLPTIETMSGALAACAASLMKLTSTSRT